MRAPPNETTDTINPTKRRSASWIGTADNKRSASLLGISFSNPVNNDNPSLVNTDTDSMKQFFKQKFYFAEENVIF